MGVGEGGRKIDYVSWGRFVATHVVVYLEEADLVFFVFFGVPFPGDELGGGEGPGRVYREVG